MIVDAQWLQVKTFAVARNLSIQYIDYNGNYYLSVSDGSFGVQTILSQEDPNNADLIDFETNFKSNGNKTVLTNTAIQTQPPFGAKTITINGTTKRLFARFTGSQYVVNTGSNTLTFTATYPWVKIIGVEAVNTEPLDTVDLKVKDDANGTYSGIPNSLLNQFSYTLNMPGGLYQRTAQFDADLYAGMIIEITYVSISNKTVGINFLMNEVKT